MSEAKPKKKVLQHINDFNKKQYENMKKFNKEQIYNLKELNRKSFEGIKNISSEYSQRLKTAGLNFWIIMFSIFFSVLFFMSKFITIIKDSIAIYGYPSIFIIAFFTEFLIQPIGPDIPLIFGMIFLGHPVIVLLCVIVATNIALVATYFVGKKIGAAGIANMVGQKMFEKIKDEKQKGKWFLFIGAVTPAPYIPYLAGFWELSFWDTVLYLAIPRTVRLIVIALLTYYFGSAISALLT